MDSEKLADSVEHLKHSIDAQREAYEKANQTNPSVTITNFRSDIAVPVQNKTKKTKPEWTWAILKGFLEVIGIVAVIAYTGLTFRTWQEIQTQTLLLRAINKPLVNLSFLKCHHSDQQQHIMGVIRVQNLGNIDAQEISIATKLTFEPPNATDYGALKDFVKLPGILPPRRDIPPDSAPALDDIVTWKESPSEYPVYKNRTFYIWGVILFNDVTQILGKPLVRPVRLEEV